MTPSTKRFDTLLEVSRIDQLEIILPNPYLHPLSAIINYQPSSSLPTWKKVSHLATKLLISAACFVSSFSDLASAKQNFDNPILQNIFAYGDALAWGTLSIYCALELYYNFIERDTPGSNRQMHQCAFIMHCSAVIILGLLSELPTAYTSYFYNRGTLFWAIYTPIISSFFGMESINILIAKLLRSNSILRRGCLNAHALQLVKVQTAFCKTIKASNQSLSLAYNQTFHTKIIELKTSSNTQLAQCKGVMLEVLQIGLRHIRSELASKPPWMDNVKTTTKVISSFLPLGSPFLDGLLIYKGFHLVINQNWPIPFIILLAVGPGIYLKVKLTQKFYVKLVNHIVNLRNFNCHETTYGEIVSTAVKCATIGVLTILGLATDTTVTRDNLGFNNFAGCIASFSVISTMAILLILSMNAMTDGIVTFIQKRKRTITQIEYDNLLDQIEMIEGYFKNLSVADFEHLIADLEIPEASFMLITDENAIESAFVDTLPDSEDNDGNSSLDDGDDKRRLITFDGFQQSL